MRFKTTIGRIKKLIDRGQSVPDRVDRTKQSLVKWWHKLRLMQTFKLLLGWCSWPYYSQPETSLASIKHPKEKCCCEARAYNNNGP